MIATERKERAISDKGSTLALQARRDGSVPSWSTSLRDRAVAAQQPHTLCVGEFDSPSRYQFVSRPRRDIESAGNNLRTQTLKVHVGKNERSNYTAREGSRPVKSGHVSNHMKIRAGNGLVNRDSDKKLQGSHFLPT